MDSWTTADVVAWVERSFTGKLRDCLAEGFAARELTGSTLQTLDDEDLRMMGVTMGSFRRRVLAKITAVIPSSLVGSNTILPSTPAKRKHLSVTSKCFTPGIKPTSPGVGSPGKPTPARPSQTPNRPVCRLGKDCRRKDCYYAHPRKLEPTEGSHGPCRDGDSCVRSDCWFKHPSGQNRSGLCVRARVSTRNVLPAEPREVDERFRRPGPTSLNSESRAVGSSMTVSGNPERKVKWIMENDLVKTATDILKTVRNPTNWAAPGMYNEEGLGWIKYSDFTDLLSKTYPQLSEIPVAGAYLSCKYPYIEFMSRQEGNHDVPYLRLASMMPDLESQLGASPPRASGPNSPYVTQKCWRANRQMFQVLKPWFDQRDMTVQVIRDSMHCGQERDLAHRFNEVSKTAGALLFMPADLANDIVKSFGHKRESIRTTSAAQLLAIPLAALQCCPECACDSEVGVNVCLDGDRVENCCARTCPLRRACEAAMLPETIQAALYNEPIATVRPYLLRLVLEQYPQLVDATHNLPSNYVVLCSVEIPKDRAYRGRGSLKHADYCHIDVGMTGMGRVEGVDKLTSEKEGKEPGLAAAVRKMFEEAHITTSESLVSSSTQELVRNRMGLAGFPYVARQYGDNVSEQYFIIVPPEATVEHLHDQEMVIKRGKLVTHTRKVDLCHIHYE